MTTDALLVQIRSLEAQLAVLKADLRQSGQPPKSLAAYYGVLKGASETTEQEIESAKLAIKMNPV
ncbi:MAG: hypothetical protein FJ030_18975 [Chloroflexi bacterium]|nr:hypothetical protein [Chloroflexota bacterium]